MRILISLTLFVTINLLYYSNSLPLRHEEPRRAIISEEMILTKNFIVPKVCQIPYYKKPPFQNWMIALTSFKDKYISNFDARIPSLMFFLIMVFAVFFLTNNSIPAIITLTSLSTMVSYGIKAEPDIIFASLFFLSYYFFMKKKFFTSSIFMGLSILTKGITPIFFYPPMIIFAFFNENRKTFLKNLLTHFIFSLILPFLWLLLYYFYGNLNEFIKNAFMQVTERTVANFKIILKDASLFPFRVISAVSPWTIILFFAFKNNFNRKDNILLSSFLIFAFIFTLLFILPCGKGRYFLPAVPFFAIFLSSLIDFEKKIDFKILKSISFLSLITFTGFSIFLFIKTHFLLKSIFLFGWGVIFYFIAYKIENIKHLGIYFACTILILSVHFFKCYRVFYLYNYKKDAKVISIKLKKFNLPVVIDGRFRNLKFIFNIEREMKKPVYKNANFKKFIFISKNSIKNGKLIFTKKVKNDLLKFYLITRWHNKHLNFGGWFFGNVLWQLLQNLSASFFFMEKNFLWLLSLGKGGVEGSGAIFKKTIIKIPIIIKIKFAIIFFFIVIFLKFLLFFFYKNLFFQEYNPQILKLKQVECYLLLQVPIHF